MVKAVLARHCEEERRSNLLLIKEIASLSLAMTLRHFFIDTTPGTFRKPEGFLKNCNIEPSLGALIDDDIIRRHWVKRLPVEVLF